MVHFLIELFDAVAFLGPVSFVLGMGIVLNPDKAGKGFKNVTQKLYSNVILNNRYNIPQQVQATLDMSEWNMGFNLSVYLLKFSFYFCTAYLATFVTGINELYTLPTIQLAMWNLIVFYSYRTKSYSSWAVFFHEDISFWSLAKRRTYVLLPFNLLGRQKLANNLTIKEAAGSFDLLLPGIIQSAVTASILAAATGGAYVFLPNVVHFLMSPLYIFLWNELLVLFDRSYEAFNLVAFQNKFDPIVGNCKSIVFDGEGYENFGRQYNYMRQLNIIIQDYSKSLVYSKYKSKYGLAGGKAATVFMRGLLVIAPLITLGLVDVEAAAIMQSYYALHAGFMFVNHKQDDHFDADFPRIVAALVEGGVGAMLWYQPLIQSITATDV